MRQGQQNRRGRGRNHNQGRKGQNPLTRTFESNGPDVKIRGTPSHIAEKYMTLARDAHSSGDPVLAENYLQHAEHYNRIIMAYREQQVAQGGADYANGGNNNNGLGRPQQRFGESGDDYEDGDGEEYAAEGQQPRGQEPQPQPQPQAPRFDDRPQRQFDSPGRNQPQHQQHYRDRDRDRDRHSGGGERRFQQDRGDRQDRFERADRGDRGERVERSGEADNAQRGRDRGGERVAQQQHEQPEFLRRPVRRLRREDESAAAPAEGAEPAPAGSDDRD